MHKLLISIIFVALCGCGVEVATDTIYCKFVKPEAYIIHNQDMFYDLKDVVAFAKQMAQTVTFVDDKQAKKIKQQLNSYIRTSEQISTDNVSDFDCDPNLIRLWLLVKSIKDDALYLCRNNGPAAYIGQNRIDAEGYVYSNEYGTMKLVNRERFSHANFNNAKFNQGVCQ